MSADRYELWAHRIKRRYATMKKPLFTGTCTALVTPFIGGAVNYPMLEVLIRRQIDAGIRAIVIAGTTGEASTLSDQEKLEMFRIAKAAAADRCLIIAGTGSNDTTHAVELSIAAQEAGADGLLVVSPYYNKAEADGLAAHYISVAHAVRLPVIIYNVPSRTGLDIPVTVYRTLSRIPNIAGVKEASPSIAKILQILAECGEEMPIWSGNDDMTAAMMALGAKGVISVASNVDPVRMNALANAALDGDFDTAAALQIQLQPLITTLFKQVNPIPVKACMEMLGYDCGSCRLPLTKASETCAAELAKILKKMPPV